MTTPPRHQTKCPQYTYAPRRESSTMALQPYQTDLQQRLQHRLLQETHHTLQRLQETLAAMEELLHNLQERQNQLGNFRTETRPKEDSNCQRLRATGLCFKCRKKGLTWECPHHNTLPGWLKAEEYRQKRKQGLCFKCREKGLAWQCPRHDQSNQQCPQCQNSKPHDDKSNRTKENSNNEPEDRPTKKRPTSKGKGRRTCSLSSHQTTSSEQ